MVLSHEVMLFKGWSWPAWSQWRLEKLAQWEGRTYSSFTDSYIKLSTFKYAILCKCKHRYFSQNILVATRQNILMSNWQLRWGYETHLQIPSKRNGYRLLILFLILSAFDFIFLRNVNVCHWLAYLWKLRSMSFPKFLGSQSTSLISYTLDAS